MDKKQFDELWQILRDIEYWATEVGVIATVRSQTPHEYLDKNTHEEHNKARERVKESRRKALDLVREWLNNNG